eukprot:scaffold83420_cov114-Cyclotella_meneghiniana.AAC.2
MSIWLSADSFNAKILAKFGLLRSDDENHDEKSRTRFARPPKSSPRKIMFHPALQYIWVQEWRALKNTLPIVIVTFAIDCWGKMRPIHLLGFALKLDIDEVRAIRSHSCETIL